MSAASPQQPSHLLIDDINGDKLPIYPVDQREIIASCENIHKTYLLGVEGTDTAVWAHRLRAALRMNPHGLTVELSTARPTAEKVEAIRGRVPGRAGVVVTGRLGFLVFNLGDDISGLFAGIGTKIQGATPAAS